MSKESLMKSLARTVLFVYLLILVWLVLFKFSIHIPGVFDSHIRRLNLIPFAGVAKNNLNDIVYNIVFFVPFGLLLGVNLKSNSFWQRLKYVFLFSLAAEILQFVFAIGITDITDVITNTAGGLAGLALYSLNQRYFDRKRADKWATLTTGVFAVFVCSLILSFQILHNRHRLQFARPSAAPAQMTVANAAQLEWPAVGQAAVANVEERELAHSSANEQPRPTASMAKVIAALAIMEKQPFALGGQGQTYIMTRQDIVGMNAYAAENGSVLPLQIGTELTQYQAMQRMLIASDNNMADILTERVFGSKQAYVSYANAMVKHMGLDRTVVADASGFDPATVSTPSELVSIGIAALKNPVIAEIVGQQQAQLPDIGIIQNTNELLGTDGVVGIKTGTTDEAGSCLLFAARYVNKAGQTRTIIGVIMGDTNHGRLYSDSTKLLASVRQAFSLTVIQSADNNATARSSFSDQAP